jgi:prevent-host-death family protein
MQVSLSELKINIGKYIDMAERQDIFITKNGKQVAKIVSTRIDKVSAMKSIFGAIPADADLNKAEMERLQ